MTRIVWTHIAYTFVVSTILNLAVFFVGKAIGVTFAVAQVSDGSLTTTFVLIMSLVIVIIGSIVFWILRLDFGGRQRFWFIWSVTILGLIFMIAPWRISQDLPTLGLLGLMNAIPILVMIWYLGVWLPEDKYELLS
ncbi:MAG: hypothetical protein ACI9EW_003575 [Cellvibrionaceae bacterium]|jgi:hypothetical protein